MGGGVVDEIEEGVVGGELWMHCLDQEALDCDAARLGAMLVDGDPGVLREAVDVGFLVAEFGEIGSLVKCRGHQVPKHLAHVEAAVGLKAWQAQVHIVLSGFQPRNDVVEILSAHRCHKFVDFHVFRQDNEHAQLAVVIFLRHRLALAVLVVLLTKVLEHRGHLSGGAVVASEVSIPSVVLVEWGLPLCLEFHVIDKVGNLVDMSLLDNILKFASRLLLDPLIELPRRLGGAKVEIAHLGIISSFNGLDKGWIDGKSLAQCQIVAHRH